jgi:ribosomal-protein-alanine N-acetyltransferase
MQTERTLWALLEEKDLPDMMEMAREPDTFQYLKKFRDMTKEEYGRFLYTKLDQIRQKKGYHWAVRLKSTGAFVGAVNLNPVGDSSRRQIGCQLRREFWQQGFASELTKRVLTFAIEEAGLTEVYGVFEKDNFISRRLLEKLGFVWQETNTSEGIEIEIHKYSSRKKDTP